MHEKLVSFGDSGVVRVNLPGWVSGWGTVRCGGGFPAGSRPEFFDFLVVDAANQVEEHAADGSSQEKADAFLRDCFRSHHLMLHTWIDVLSRFRHTCAIGPSTA